MKLKPQTRFLQSEIKVDAATRTITFPFSSEAPVARWFGSEILVHDEASMDTARLNDGAPLLFNHELNDVVGVVERAWINKEDRRGYATVRFARTARADEVLGMVQDKILPNVSFMYRVVDVAEDPKKNEWRVTRFEPLEISIVTVPADQSVGIGRAFVDIESEVRVTRTEATSAQEDRAIQPATIAKGAIMSEVQSTAAATVTEPVTQTSLQMEEQRISAIKNMAKANRVPENIERKWINEGTDWNKIGAEMLAIQEKRSQESAASFVDLPVKEVNRYSMWRALKAVQSGRWEDAGLELEASRAVSQRIGRANDKNSFFVPMDIQQRDLTVGTASAGGYLRETSNISFIEMLRNRMVAYRMGARRMSGLVGNVTIPKQTTGATAYWLSTEATSLTEGNQVFGQLALTPRTVGAYTEISRLLQLQSSPDAEQIVMSDLAQQVAAAADLAVLAGTGTEQPTGITQTASIGTFTGTSLAAAGVLEAQADVADNNALMGSCGYVTTSTVAKLLMARPELPTTGTTRLWTGSMLDGALFGFPAMTSAQMAAGTMIFGAWDQVIVGEWGVLELAVNPQANFPAGITGLRAMYTMDVGVRYAGAFSVATSIT